MNPLKTLNRLLNRGVTAPVAALLYENIYHQPLLIEPNAASAIIDGYLHGTIPESRNDDSENHSRIVSYIDSSIAVINISGALTARPTGGDMCSAAPLSYEEITLELKCLFENENVTTIIAQFASCGGQAMNMCDASDFIYSMRGQGKSLIAMIDMQAASAAYGLASAFDEIWITRTAVAGSIGTYVCLPNIQERNKMEGISFTYVASDAHKLDGNPDEPLSDDAKKMFSDDVLSIDKTFKETVARNLGVPAQQIYDMQARWYRGEEAVKMGLAHKVGTFDDLIESLLTTQEVNMTTPTSSGDNGAFTQLSETVNTLARQMGTLTGLVQSLAEQPKLQATATEIAGLCAAAGVPNAMAGLLIKSGASIEEVRAALQNNDIEQSSKVDISDFLSAKNNSKPKTETYDAFSMQEALDAQRDVHLGGK